MTEKEKNIEKRKNEPLTKDEWFTFFFFPFGKLGSFDLMNTDSFNEVEENRFEKFGFDKKIKQSQTARFYGYLFYFGIILLIIVLTK